MFPAAVFQADLDASSLTISFVSTGATFFGADFVFRFFDLDWLPLPGAITDFDLTVSTFQGVTTTFGPDSIEVMIPDQSFLDGAQLSAHFDIVASHGIPTPTTALLLAIGGAALIRMRRRGV